MAEMPHTQQPLQENRSEGKLKPVIVLAAVILVLAFGSWAVISSGVLPNLFLKPDAETAPAGNIIQPDPDGFKSAQSGVDEIPLTVVNPSRDLTVTAAALEVTGQTSARAEVFVNEKETMADDDGKFTVAITLEEGENYLTIVATDEDGKVAEVERVVTYEPAE